MTQLNKLVRHWCCDWCNHTWPVSNEVKPKQCGSCGRRNWDHPAGIFKKSDDRFALEASARYGSACC